MSLGQHVVHRAKFAAVHFCDGQLGQRDHRAVSAQDRVRQLEQGVRLKRQALVTCLMGTSRLRLAPANPIAPLARRYRSPEGPGATAFTRISGASS